MNRILLCTTLTLAATPFVSHASDSPESPNRFSFGARFGMNFKADFQNSPTFLPFNPAVNPGAATGGVNHNYDDGYVRLDSSGNAGGVTWNWGYNNASQVVGDSMQYHARQANPFYGAAENKVTDDPQYGVELIYQRVIAPLGSSGRWGLEAGFSYTDLDLRGKSSGPGVSQLTTDSFALNGVLPPGAGYQGTFAGPGPLLGDTPSRSIAYDSRSSRDKLSGQMFAIRLGPFAEWDLTPKLNLSASVGLTLAPTSLDYDFTDVTSVAGGGTFVGSGHASKTGLLYGPYVSAMLRYDFNKSWGVFVGAQFQSLNDLKVSSGGRSSRLDQAATVYGTVGLTYKF